MRDILNRNAYQLFYAGKQNTNITIVAIDDKSLRTQKLKWPWPRQRFAELTEKISSCEPGVIAYDISFIGKSAYGPDDDEAFAQSIKNAGNVVLSSYIGNDGIDVMPIETLAGAAASVGFVNKLKDLSSIIRYARVVLKDRIKSDFSFECKALSVYEREPVSDIKIIDNTLFIGRHRIITGWNGIIPIKYTETAANLHILSASDILDGNFDISSIKNRLVIVASTSESIHDIYTTPFGSVPGVLISANLISNLINNNILNNMPSFYIMLIFLFLILFSALTGFRYSLPASFAATSLIVCANYALALFAFKNNLLYDAFGGAVLAYSGLVVARIYRHVKQQVEKNRMFNALTVDEDTGLQNIYYLLMKLKGALEAPTEKNASVGLIMVEAIGKRKALSSLDDNAIKELLISTQSMLANIVKKNNGIVARISAFNLGVMIPRLEKDELDQLAHSIYARLDNLELILHRGRMRLNITCAVGAVSASDLDKASARLMIYAGDDALSKSKLSDDKKIHIYDPAKEALAMDSAGPATPGAEVMLFDFVLDEMKEQNRALQAKIEELNSRVTDYKNSYLTVITSFVKALEEKDVYTAGHSERVAEYSSKLAAAIGIKQGPRETIRIAALLHDIGKIGMPDNVLRKKDTLTEDDKNIIKKHEIESVKILEPILFFKEALPMILHHHEHYDGSGYPHGLTGERIPLGSRIIALADSFDAMTSGRGYNNPLNTDEAAAILLKDSGKQFDPALVGKFIDIIKNT